jgi:Na+/melibiose symporter-like transporter
MTAQHARRLSPLMLAAYSSPYMPVGALVICLVVYLPNYYASHLGLDLTTAGWAFTVVRLFDICFDPFAGAAMDGMRLRWGRYRPFLVLSSPLIAIAVYELFMAEPGVTANYLVAWLVVLYVGFSLCVLSQAAWGAALVPDYHERSRVYSRIQIFGVVGAVGALLLPPLLHSLFGTGQVEGVQAMGWFIICAAPITAFIAAARVPEPPESPRRERVSWRDYRALLARHSMIRVLLADLFLTLGPAITAALYFFFFREARGYSLQQANVLLLIYICAGFGGAPFFAWLSGRIGKHRTIIFASILHGITQSCVLLLPAANVTLMAPAMFIVGFIASAYLFLLNAMVADVSDEVRLETGKDRIGLLYALFTGVQKIGSALSVGITFTILDNIGFKAAEGSVNTPDAIWGLEACFVAAPVLSILVGGAAMWGYRLTEQRHQEIRDGLAVRDGLAAAETESVTVSGPLAPAAAVEG